MDELREAATAAVAWIQERLEYVSGDVRTEGRRIVAQLEAAIGERVDVKLPPWAGGNAELAAVVTAIVDEVIWPECDQPKDEDGNPTGRWPLRRTAFASKADAKAVLALWREGLGSPPLGEFLEQARLVAAAARASNHPLFARDIRGVNWPGAPDRSRAVATLMVQAKWTERLQAAERWQFGTRLVETRKAQRARTDDGDEFLPSLADE